MSRTVRFWVLGIGLAGVAALLLAAFLDLPDFGAADHPYRDAAVHAAVDRATPNVISSINFDQRALDTLIEETILFGSVLAVAALLRPSDEEHLHRPDIPDVDLFIRTSGEQRLSGFLLWQSAYSEMWFTEAHWPAFRRVDFLRALRDYTRRHRRYGT